MTLLTPERRPTRWQFLAADLSPIFLNTGTTKETFQQSGKQDSFNTYSRVWLVGMKVQARSSLEPPLEYNKYKTLLMNQGLL